MSTSEELKAMLLKVEQQKEKIAAERDVLRGMVGDLESILEALDEGVNGLEDGLRSLNDALDSIGSFL